MLKDKVAFVLNGNLDLYNISKSIPESFKIWTLNGVFEKIENIDVLFDLHDWTTCEYKEPYSIPKYYSVLQNKNNKFKIIKTKSDNTLKNVVLYPLSDIIKSYGMNLKNSVPMMMLYAWWIGNVDTIYIYGITKNEFYKYPEMGFSFYQALGFIRAKGINVFIISDFELNNDNDIYGYYKLTNSVVKG